MAQRLAGSCSSWLRRRRQRCQRSKEGRLVRVCTRAYLIGWSAWSALSRAGVVFVCVLTERGQPVQDARKEGKGREGVRAGAKEQRGVDPLSTT